MQHTKTFRLRSAARVAAAMFVCLIAQAAVSGADKDEDGTGPLEWKLASKQSLNLRASFDILNADLKTVNQGEKRITRLDPGVKDFTYFGYHFAGVDGKLALSEADNLEQQMLEVCFRVPGKKARKGTKWAESFEIAPRMPGGGHFGHVLPLAVDAAYEALEPVVVEQKKFENYRVTVSEPKAPKTKKATHKGEWTKFSFEASVDFDGERGYLRSVDFTLKGTAEVDLPQTNAFGVVTPAHHVTYEAHWHGAVAPLGAPSDALNDTVLMEQVKKSIVKGREAMMKRLADAPPHWGGYVGHGSGHYMGVNALCALTVIKCGANRKDPKLLKVFDYLATLEPDTDYDAAIYIMAIEALVTPESEDQAFLKGEKVDQYQRPLTDKQRSEIQRMADFIATCNNATSGGFSYKPNPTGWDMSNTQYSALGLNSARRCGIKVDPKLFGGLLKLGLKTQMADGKTVKRTEDVQEDGKRPPRVRYASKPDKARGWGYIGPGMASGSMSTAGVAVVVTALDGLLSLDSIDAQCEALGINKGEYRRTIEDVRKTLRDGVAWLTDNFTVISNPGAGNQAWHFYYLYGLERAAVLTDTRWLGEHDWYREGASFLVQRQSDEGMWGEGRNQQINTCFALLFLKRGTVPPKQRVLTGGER